MFMGQSFVRRQEEEEDDMIDITSAEVKNDRNPQPTLKDDAFIRAPQTPSPMLVHVP